MTLHTLVRVEGEALHDRSLRARFPDGMSTLLFLSRGELSLPDREGSIEQPSLMFWPAALPPGIVMGAGGQAVLFGLSESILLEAIGARSESVYLRMLVETAFVAPITDAYVLDQAQTLVNWFAKEATEAGLRSPMSMSAILRLLLIVALRVHQPAKSEKAAGQTHLLRHFRHLVELNFRNHWLIEKYAKELGISYDRLHRICKRELGRSPADLVHDRLAAEAKARLERSGAPLKKIASDLGFADASRFSHFFRRRTNMSPGAYRSIVSRPEGDDLSELRQGFSDWP